MDIIWGTTTTRVSSGGLAADAPINWQEVSPGGIRRNYSGAARKQELYSKYRAAMSWTGVDSANAQILRDIKNYGTTLTFTGLAAPIPDTIAGTLYMLYVPGSYSIAESGYNIYDISMTFEEE